MIIDRSYFIGEINVPHRDRVEVAPLLDMFIEQYETDFLKRALGGLYSAFIAGLSTTPIEDKWNAILLGDTYSHYGRQATWEGLVSDPTTVLSASEATGSIDLVVDRGRVNDPVSQVGGVPNSTLTIPASVVGNPFYIYQRSVGQLRPDEYTVAGNQLTLIGSTLNSGETYFFKSAGVNVTPSTGVNKTSPLANYTYYWFMLNAHTQTASMGEVKAKTENAVPANPAGKMVRAYNKANESFERLQQFLLANANTYGYVPSYVYGGGWSVSLGRTNELNI